ncbi:HNH endonuclease [Arthrobacter sp. PsM3]|uniref:HNH endonuclease n=1 Tax=Arthrobacter sp. PsM3 TaxID=3030531 RepID=UPI003460D914
MSNPRRANSSLRNKLRARVIREETHCWLCSLPVDKTLPHGQPGSPEIDEVIPVSKGGSPYERSNCRLAHRLCNQKRGNRQPQHGEKAPPSPLAPLKTSRRW